MRPNAQLEAYYLQYSYNNYVTKSLVLSGYLAKQKMGIAVSKEIPEDRKGEYLDLVKQYFTDFMRLSGADPKTMNAL